EDRLVFIAFYTNVIDVIVLNQIALRGGFSVAPRPAHRNSGVPEAVNVVVGNRVIMRLADPHGDATGKKIAAVGDRAVGNFIVRRLIFFAGAHHRLADFYSAGAGVMDIAMGDAVVLAAARKLDSIGADVRDGAMIERAGANAFSPDRARNA